MNDPASMPAVSMKCRVIIRFYEELNDLLRRDHKKQDIVCEFFGKRTVKDAIESFGVPHTEIDLILANGLSVGFDYLLKDGDRISVYPTFERFSIGGVAKLRDKPLRDTRFVVDVHLGKLARNLKLLGFDTDYQNLRDDDELARIAAGEKRVLLTRDRRLLMRNAVDRGMILHSNVPFDQTLEVLNRLDLWDVLRPFSRCLACGGQLIDVPAKGSAYDEALRSVPPLVLSWCKEFRRCSQCGRVFWKGSHFDKLEALIHNLLRARSNPLG